MESIESKESNLIEYAWGIIANVSGSDWSLQSEEWQGAAERWRDQYHDWLKETLLYEDEEIDLVKEKE